MILSLDTSNYTTSVCVFDQSKGIIWENRIVLHPPRGERGLRQSDVVFLHVRNFETLLASIPHCSIEQIVVSARPCPNDRSYMPCFTVGKNFALSLGACLNVPVTFYSHQEGHIMAGLYSGACMRLLKGDFYAFHVSGGTTDLLHVTPQKTGLDIERIGGSSDLHAGQLIDRIGVMLGLEFPCGKSLEILAATAQASRPMKVSVQGNEFHFSGFENQAKVLLEQQMPHAEIARFALDAVAKTLHAEIAELRSANTEKPILFVGGVMSNRYIAQYLIKRNKKIYFSAPEYATDNALGNAVLHTYLNFPQKN